MRVRSVDEGERVGIWAEGSGTGHRPSSCRRLRTTAIATPSTGKSAARLSYRWPAIACAEHSRRPRREPGFSKSPRRPGAGRRRASASAESTRWLPCLDVSPAGTRGRAGHRDGLSATDSRRPRRHREPAHLRNLRARRARWWTRVDEIEIGGERGQRAEDVVLKPVESMMLEGIPSLVDDGYVDAESSERERNHRFEAAEVEHLPRAMRLPHEAGGRSR